VECPKCNFENPEDISYCGKCGAQLPSSAESSILHTETLESPKEELTTGSIFAERYQIVEELGKGGMGRVYRAVDKKLKEEVALKLLKPEIASDKKTIDRFSNELKFARKIAHKNVGRMYELLEDKGAHFITMEYVAGQDLKGLIRQTGQLAIGTTVSIVKQVCEGLIEAHRLGIVHRDLKPSNLMIDKEGNARIMDFGIARSLRAKGITGAGVMIGTPEYMSPEQVEGKETDQRSDIYSLGVMLYEMLTGRVPFEGDTAFAIGVKQKSEVPKDPKEINSQIPDDLSRLILRCMEKEKAKRYQNSREVCSELKNIEKGIPTTDRVVPKRKPLTSREITVTFGMKKLFIPALVVVALIITAVVIWRLLPRKDVIPIPSDKPSLAIMYFKNDTGNEGLDHWRSALSQWLITDLSQSKHINVLPADRLFSILRKLNLLEARSYATEDLEKVAAEGRVNHIFQAGFSKAGDIFRIDYSLQKADTLESIGSDYVKGKGEESFPTMVDELTQRIKADFKLSEEEIASDLDKEVGEITTSAPEAYKYYSEGRKYHLSGDYRQSIPFMERAIEIDPEFAMAYRSLAIAHSNLGNAEERSKYLKKAFELSDRISDKEKYWIQGDYYRRVEEDYDQAIRAYNKLLELDPEHFAGHNNIALIYSRLEDWDKAIEHLEVCRKTKTEFRGSYTNLANYYGAKRMYKEAREVLRDYLSNFSDDARIHAHLANSYVHEGKLDLALEEADKAIVLNPTSYNKIWIYYLQGDFAAVEKECIEWLKEDEKQRHAQARNWLIDLYSTQGKFEKAKEQAELGLKLTKESDLTGWESGFHIKLASIHLAAGSPEEALEEANTLWKKAVENNALGFKYTALYLKLYAHLDIGSLEEAQKAADQVKELVDKEINKKVIRSYYHFLGRIELKKENFPKAIEYLEKTLSMLNYGPLTWDADFIEPLALAYYRSGKLEKAREQYEIIITLTTGRIDFGDIYAKSFYMLGKIYQEQVKKNKAIENYEKFLNIWKEADPGIPEVEDAKKQLAELQELPE
jgi:serine/threonine protein kinase/Tfp pilus assembly protein PilF